MQKLGGFMRRNLKYIIPVLLLALTLFSFSLENRKGDNKDKILIYLLKNLLASNHFEPNEINDEFSIEVFDNFIENLDPAKRYFIQSDIDEFEKYKTQIDNQILNDEVDFFNLVYARFLQRVEEAKTYYVEILDTPYNFSNDDVLNVDYENKPFAQNKAELKEVWRKQLKFSTLSRLHDKISAGFIDEKTSEEISDFEVEFRNNISDDAFKFNDIYSTEKQIQQVQQILVEHGINVGSTGPDGVYGKSTEVAIEKYKKKLNPDLEKISDEQFAKLEIEARESTKKNYDDFYERISDFDHADWFATFLNSITEAYDPHTSYFPPRTKKAFDERLSGKLEGIGARLMQKNDYTKVSELISGGPAWRAGELEVGDIILKVAQGEEEPLDIVGMRLSDAIEFIKGPKGTEVKLTLKKIDGSIEVISIIRDIVEIEETFVKSSVIEKEGKKFGIINLPSFYIDFKDRDARNCAKDMAIEIERLKEEDVEGILIDLRNNGGGSLPAVIEMAGLFIKDGPIVQVKYKDEKPIVQKDRDKSILWNGPLVVLTNELSASASEIFAAAMQDYKRAVVIGSKQTYGKGTVQTVMDLNRYYNFNGDLGGMTLTIQKFYRINGGSTQLEGVKPDVILPSRYTYMDIGEKEYSNPLPWDQIKKANYDLWNNYSNFDEVVINSVERINQNSQFMLIDENAKWLKGVQEDTNVYLNYDAYTDDLDKHAEESKRFDRLSKYETDLTFNSPQYELPIIEQDSILEKKRTLWHTNLSKDVYIEEGLNILGDLKLKQPYNVAIKN
ncbi:MAG: carboxy terminal-processing peptidase [Urechidicola sp.]|nr:carboxy terminal-processing peptidase [Urechidicola sp.]